MPCTYTRLVCGSQASFAEHHTLMVCVILHVTFVVATVMYTSVCVCVCVWFLAGRQHAASSFSYTYVPWIPVSGEPLNWEAVHLPIMSSICDLTTGCRYFKSSVRPHTPSWTDRFLPHIGERTVSVLGIKFHTAD